MTVSEITETIAAAFAETPSVPAAEIAAAVWTSVGDADACNAIALGLQRRASRLPGSVPAKAGIRECFLELARLVIAHDRAVAQRQRKIETGHVTQIESADDTEAREARNATRRHDERASSAGRAD